MDGARAVLLVAYYYPPLGGVGSQRALSFARHLPEHGFRTVVVTPARGAYGIDATLPTDLAQVVRTGSFEPAVLARRLGLARGGGDEAAGGDMVEGVRGGALTSLARRMLHRSAYFPDHARGWISPAVRAAVRAGRETGAVAVVSTSPPVSGHLVAVRVARALRIPAVLDFRDLWTAHPDTPRAGAARRLEHRLLRDAAAVTTVSERWRAWLLDRYAEGEAKPFRVVRNGFDESDFVDPPPPPEPGVFRIVHTGTIYGARQDTTAFFRALAAVRRDGSLTGLRPEVVLAGKIDPHALDAARAAECDDIVRAPGFVPHPEAVRLLRTATVNLLLTWTVPGVVAEGVCPGKMYEQIAARRPVLALALPGNEASQILRETGGALIARPDDAAGIADALRWLAAAARDGDAGAAVPPWKPDAARHSRRVAAAEFADVLRSVLA